MMKQNGHFDTVNDAYCVILTANSNTLKSILEIAPNYKVDLTMENSIRSVLGFNRLIYSAGYNESENIANIMHISSLNVTSDITTSSFTKGTTKNIIYSFFPNVGPGYKVIEQPLNLIYLPVTLCSISHLETRLDDQDGNLINLCGELLSLRFHIREA